MKNNAISSRKRRVALEEKLPVRTLCQMIMSMWGIPIYQSLRRQIPYNSAFSAGDVLHEACLSMALALLRAFKWDEQDETFQISSNQIEAFCSPQAYLRTVVNRQLTLMKKMSACYTLSLEIDRDRQADTEASDDTDPAHLTLA